MWILTAFFQSIAQALTWILPVSESGHSAIFHNFSGRFTDACSQLTGVIHIGIAIGLIVAFSRLFLSLFRSFTASINDIFHKEFTLKNISPARSFMLMTLVTFLFYVLYLIPAGEYGNVYAIFHRASYNKTILGEGICLALLGVLIIVAIGLVNSKYNKLPNWANAVIFGIISFLAVPVGGCSLMGAIFTVGIMLGLGSKYSLRYSVAISVPTLIVMGITEIFTAVTTVNFGSAIIAIIVSALSSFFIAKLLIYIIKKNAVKYFAYYDISVGSVCVIIGVFELVVK